MVQTLIINPPFLEPHRPPIAPAILAEIARLKGHVATVLDINIDLYRHLGSDQFLHYQTEYVFGTDKQCEKSLRDFIYSSLDAADLGSKDWVLISCFSAWEYAITVLICEYVRPLVKGKVVIGGPGVENKGRSILDNGLCDYWIRGEGELALDALFEGNDKYPGINGTSPVQIDDLDPLPLPNWDYFDFTKYDWLLDSPDVFVYGSRGCIRHCSFCDVEHYWPKFRWRTGTNIAQELIKNYERYGVKNFYFSDSLINGNLKEFQVFLKTLIDYPFSKEFRWGGYAIVRPKKSHPAELYDMMAQAGKTFWVVGIETGVDRIRIDMQKKFTNEDIDWHLEQSQRIGLQNMFLMISSWYDETLEEHEDYLKIFPRWQNFAVDGTIMGITINPPLIMLPNAPVHSMVEHQQIFLETGVKDNLRELAWVNPNMPDLTFHERYRRTSALVKEALKYNWPLHDKTNKLNEIKTALTTYREKFNTDSFSAGGRESLRSVDMIHTRPIIPIIKNIPDSNTA